MTNKPGSTSCFRHHNPSQNLIASVQSLKYECLLSEILSKYINNFTHSSKTNESQDKSSSSSTVSRNSFAPSTLSSSTSKDCANLESDSSINWLSKNSPASAVTFSKSQKPLQKSKKLNSLKSSNVTLTKFFQPTQKSAVSAERSSGSQAETDTQDSVVISDSEEEIITSRSQPAVVDLVIDDSSGDEFLPPPNRSLNRSFKSQISENSSLNSLSTSEKIVPRAINVPKFTSVSSDQSENIATKATNVPKSTPVSLNRGENSVPSATSIFRPGKGFIHKEPSMSLLSLVRSAQNCNGLSQTWTQLLHHYKHKLKEAEEFEKFETVRQIEQNAASRVPEIYSNQQSNFNTNFSKLEDKVCNWSPRSYVPSHFSGRNNYENYEQFSPEVESRSSTSDLHPRNNSLTGYMSPADRRTSCVLPPKQSEDYSDGLDWGAEIECDDFLDSVSNIQASTSIHSEHSLRNKEASTSTHNKSEYFQPSRHSVPSTKKPTQQQEINDDSAEFNHSNFPHYQQMLTVFRQQFGLAKFRMKQREALNAAMLGHDCFVLMPTGGGKSVCYQLPALLQPGLTVVISPLRSLILDQVNKLKSLDIPAACLMGDNSQTETNRIYSQLCRALGPDFHLMFVTPEKIVASTRLVEILQGLYNRGLLTRFVIDEAHCVSQWGHDFRPDYKRLSKLRTQFPGVPMMALTATATLRVRKDILHQLQMTDTKWFVCSFDRPNLSYSVRYKTKTTLEEIISLIKTKYPRKSGIVYGFSRKECEQTAQSLKRAGIQAECYHAGLADKQRAKVQTDWVLNKIKVVVATIAFGMGIDKPDVRFVIHFTMAKSIEGYYQEAGRAGRDGDTSDCILYFTIRDVMKLRKMIDMDTEGTKASKDTHRENLRRMVDYCENRSDCRRTIQLQYFGENYTRRCPDDPATACDNCLSQERYRIEDVTEVCKAMVVAVGQICGRSQWDNFTINHLVDICKGSRCKKVLDNGHDKLQVFSMLSAWDKVDICRLLNKLVMDDILEEFYVTKYDNTNSYIRLGPRARSFSCNGGKVVFSIRDSVKKSSVLKPTETNETRTEADAIHEQCFSELMDVVTAIAEINEVNTNTIMNIQSLKGMSLKLPETREEMLKIVGVTQANYEKYGKDLLKITSKYAEERNKLNFVEPKKRSLSPTSFRAHTGPAKKRKSSAEIPPGSYIAPYKANLKTKRKKYKPQGGRGKAAKGKMGKSGSGNYRAKFSSNGSESYRATATGSHTTLQPNRTLPPSNRPGFMPAPRVTTVRK